MHTTYQSRLGIDKVISRLSTDDGSDLHTIGVTCLSIHGHIELTQWNGLCCLGILYVYGAGKQLHMIIIDRKGSLWSVCVCCGGQCVWGQCEM